MFPALTCPSSGGKIAFTQHLVSSLSVNGCTVHRLRADCSPFSSGILYSRLQRATIPDAVRIQFVLLKMGMLMLEDSSVTYILSTNKELYITFGK
jgi:hypothetical protein